MKKHILLAGTMTLLVLLTGCSSAASVDNPETERAASNLDDRVRYGEIEYRVRGCLTNRTDGNVQYSYQRDPRQMDGTALPDRAPERFGTLGPGAFTCAYSPVSLEPLFYVEVLLGPKQGFDMFRIESLGNGFFGFQCSVNGWEMLDEGIPLNMNCGDPSEYPTTTSFDGKVTSVGGIPTYTVNWSILNQP